MRFIGPHVSIKENISFAVDRAAAIGATGFAIFTKNQRIWSAPPLSDESIESFRKKMAEKNYSPSAVLPHAGYLINPATPDEELRAKSLSLFCDFPPSTFTREHTKKETGKTDSDEVHG